MTPDSRPPEVVFSTKWFELVAKHPAGYTEPHYSINAPDYVIVVARDEQGRLLLVRQSRPAIAMKTLELPSGHVDAGETPESAARKELLEETAYVADQFEFLGDLWSDPG